MKKWNNFPRDLDVSITGDQSIQTRTSFNDLINTIVIGFILVLHCVDVFYGSEQCVLRGIKCSAECICCVPVFTNGRYDCWYQSNTQFYRALCTAYLDLGIIVDDAIVVIENTHRIFRNGSVPIKRGR